MLLHNLHNLYFPVFEAAMRSLQAGKLRLQLEDSRAASHSIQQEQKRREEQPFGKKVANLSLNFGYFVLGMHKHNSKSQIGNSLKSFFWFLKNDIPVVPGQAGGGSFQKEKNYIAQKEFAYRMRARRPTSAMPKSFLCCERAFCRSTVMMFCGLK